MLQELSILAAFMLLGVEQYEPREDRKGQEGVPSLFLHKAASEQQKTRNVK